MTVYSIVPISSFDGGCNASFCSLEDKMSVFLWFGPLMSASEQRTLGAIQKVVKTKGIKSDERCGNRPWTDA